MAYFHCYIVEGSIAVCVQKDAIDPVTPIAGANFVTGDVTDSTFTSSTGQSIYEFKYGGTQSNGSVDGNIVAVANETVSLKAELAFSPDANQINSFSALGEFPTVATTTNTVTDLGNAWLLPEGKILFIDITFDAQRTDSFDLFRRSLRYTFYRKVAGSTIEEDADQYYLNAAGGIDAELIIATNSIKAQVTGKNGQNWSWKISAFNFELEDLI